MVTLRTLQLKPRLLPQQALFQLGLLQTSCHGCSRQDLDILILPQNGMESPSSVIQNSRDSGEETQEITKASEIQGGFEELRSGTTVLSLEDFLGAVKS